MVVAKSVFSGGLIILGMITMLASGGSGFRGDRIFTLMAGMAMFVGGLWIGVE